MCIGGRQGFEPSLHDAEFVDFSPFESASLPKPANLSIPLVGNVANYVQGKVMTCGGFGNINCYIYDNTEDVWLTASSLDTVRSNAVGFVIGGLWYILGGKDGSKCLDSTVVYNDGVFQVGQDIPYCTSYACSVLLNETHVFYAGGYYDASFRQDAYLLEVDGWKWTRLSNMRQARAGHSCGRVGHKLIVVGGSDEAGATSEILSLDSLTWTSGPGAPPTPSGSIRGAAVYQEEETFYLLGGRAGNNEIATVYEFDHESFTWKERAERLVTAKSYHALVRIP